MSKALLSVPEVLDKLDAHYGRQQPSWPTDPYLFLIWWHCGYPASDSACGRGWEALNREIGTGPEQILAARPADLAGALKAGGMVPECKRANPKCEKCPVSSICAFFQGAHRGRASRVRA